MTKTVTNGARNVIGRYCMVRDHQSSDRVFYGAIVIDTLANEPDRAKRIRLQTGEHAGEVRMRGEYDIIEFTD